jgi:outer membrane protein OmpA-like peptidoglycan-associated protein
MKLYFTIICVVLSIVISGCKTVDPKLSNFEIVPSVINKGEFAEVIWRIDDAKGVEISISNIGNSLESSGNVSVNPNETTRYTIEVKKANKVLFYQSKTLLVNEVRKPDIIIPKKIIEIFNESDIFDFSKGVDDGRFTIGAGDKRLMYGYPIPLSTSHFVVKINGKFASNNPRFKNDTVKYISSTREVTGTNGSTITKMTYQFEGVTICQKLIPVDENFFEVPVNSWGKHYKIEYEIINKRGITIDVELMLLIDTMIDDNDNCRMTADKTYIDREILFTNANIPKVIQVFRRNTDKEDLYAELNITKNNTRLPNKIYIGNWPEFHCDVWDVVINEEPYFDSAILLKWENYKLESLDTISFKTYYGLPKEKNINVLLNTPNSELRETLYFGKGSSVVSQQESEKLREFIEAKKDAILGVAVEGYGDAVGTEKRNLDVSKARAQAVKNLIVKFGIKENIIIPKAFGETYADQGTEAQKSGNSEDRVVRVIIYVKDEE